MRPDFDAARDLFEDGRPKAEYSGVEGYRRAADDFASGSMHSCWKRVAKMLDAKQRKLLGWGNYFQGTTTEHGEIRSRVLSAEGKSLKSMQGIEGYRGYADAHCVGRMVKAYMTVSAVLSREEFSELDWGKSFNGTTAEHGEIRSRVLSAEGKPLKSMQGIEGYRRYADSHCVGRMAKARNTVSAVLSPEEFSNLDWGKAFAGTTSEHDEVRARVLSEEGEPLKSMQGIEGYRLYADTYCVGKLGKAYQMVSAVLCPEEFSDLGWGRLFNGHSELHRVITEELSDCAAFSTYQGLPGLMRFAAKLDCSDLKKVRRWVQVVLSKEEFKSLDWQPNPPKQFSVKRWREEHGGT